jgi:hypothetical protein
MMDGNNEPGVTGDGEETVLWHHERIGLAIISAALLVYMVKILISLFGETNLPISDALSTVALWLIAFVAIASVLIWSTLVCTVVRKGPERLTIYSKLGRLARWGSSSVLLSDLKDVVAQERLYSVKGRKTRQYVILFGPAGGKSELLGRLTRAQIESLANGVLRGILRI